MTNGYIYMEKVIKKSREQIYQGESPFAAGILVGNQFYLYGNMSRTKQNPNLHAEIVCINKFCEENDYYDKFDIKRNFFVAFIVKWFIAL